jgi:hypothetical protein
MKLRIWKSLTFFIGLILFVAAFGVILLAGSVFNPPPYRIVIALQTIDPYTELTGDMVALDEQTMNQRVASRLVHEGELEHYVGGLVVETIHAGEPLRRSAIAANDNPAASHRLSLALTDPHLVAAVVPVSPKIIPDNVTAGDYVNVTMGIEGSVSQLAGADWGAGRETYPWGSPVTPTPQLVAPSFLTSTGVLALSGEVAEVTPPLDKIVLPQVEVINVTREKVPNPNYGMALGGDDAPAQPAFLEGDIESVTLLVPNTAEELLYFAVDNGTLHLSVVPHTAVMEGASPSTGVLWEDVVRFFQEERLRALGVISSPVTATQTLSPTAMITTSALVTTSMSATPTMPPTPRVVATPLPEAEAASAEGGAFAPEALAAKLSDYVIPICVGGGLVLALAVAGYVLMRRREG